MSDKPVGAESQPERDQVAREVAERLGLDLYERDGLAHWMVHGRAVEIFDALLDKELECRRLRQELQELRQIAVHRERTGK